jgi:hypothetical protein
MSCGCNQNTSLITNIGELQNCPGAEPCSEMLNAACIVYTGTPLPKLGVASGDKLDSILQKVDGQLASLPVFGEAGTIDLICGFTGGISVQPITNNDVEFGNIVYMGDISSGGVYRFYNKAFFVNNNIKLLRIVAGNTTLNGSLPDLKRYLKIWFDATTKTQMNEIINVVGNTLDLVWSPDARYTVAFYDGTY